LTKNSLISAADLLPIVCKGLCLRGLFTVLIPPDFVVALRACQIIALCLLSDGCVCTLRFVVIVSRMSDQCSASQVRWTMLLLSFDVNRITRLVSYLCFLSLRIHTSSGLWPDFVPIFVLTCLIVFCSSMVSALFRCVEIAHSLCVFTFAPSDVRVGDAFNPILKQKNERTARHHAKCHYGFECS
jgi:hypothetical protein